MAMNKSEKAEFDAFRLERDMARSLRWPEYSKPKAMTDTEIKMEMIKSGDTSMRGWFFNTYSVSISHGCSNGIHHNRNGYKPDSQNYGYMFRNKSESIRALRVELTEKYAKILAEVDALLVDALHEEGGAA